MSTDISPERMHAKLTAIHAMLPQLGEHLPADLFAELAAHIYVLPVEQPTPADIRRGQVVAAEIAPS